VDGPLDAVARLGGDREVEKDSVLLLPDVDLVYNRGQMINTLFARDKVTALSVFPFAIVLLMNSCKKYDRRIIEQWVYVTGTHEEPPSTFREGTRGAPMAQHREGCKRHLEMMSLHLKHDRRRAFVGSSRPVNVEISLIKSRLNIGCPTSGVAQRAMREAVPHARGVSKARKL
jgi:hypothetical protein